MIPVLLLPTPCVRCGAPPALDVVFYTTTGPRIVGLCKTHILSICDVVDRIVSDGIFSETPSP